MKDGPARVFRKRKALAGILVWQKLKGFKVCLGPARQAPDLVSFEERRTQKDTAGREKYFAIRDYFMHRFPQELAFARLFFVIYFEEKKGYLMELYWFNTWHNMMDKHHYEELLQKVAQQITDELLDMYLRQVPTDKTFEELLAQRLPPCYSKHQAVISSRANTILYNKGYYITYMPGKFLENHSEHQQRQQEYWQTRVDRELLTPQAQALTVEIIAHCRQNGESNANLAELIYPHATDATPDEYLFLIENVIDGIKDAGYTIHSLDPLEISFTFTNILKPDPPEPEPANPLLALLSKLFRQRQYE